MARKQMNIRLDDLTIAAIKRIAAENNMSESQVITRAILLLEQTLRKDETMTITEGTIVTHLHAFGPQDAKVLTVNRMSNNAVIQFRDLDQTASPQNTMTVMLDRLQAK